MGAPPEERAKPVCSVPSGVDGVTGWRGESEISSSKVTGDSSGLRKVGAKDWDNGSSAGIGAEAGATVLGSLACSGRDRGGNGTRLCGGAVRTPAFSKASIGCPNWARGWAEIASATRRSCPATMPRPIMIRPPTTAVVPALISVFPKLNSLIGIPNPIMTRPANSANAPMPNNKTGILFRSLS